MDVESLGDTLEDGGFAGVVVARVDDADCFRVPFLSGLDCSPENSLAATSSIAEGMKEADHPVPLCFRDAFCPVLG